MFTCVRSIYVLSNSAFVSCFVLGTILLPLPWYLTPLIVHILLIALRSVEEWWNGDDADTVADRRAGYLWPGAVAALGGCVLARLFSRS